MAKRLIVSAFRLFVLNIVAAFIVLFFLGIKNDIIQICVESLFVLVLWVFVWLELSGSGQNDVKKDKIIRKRMEQADGKGDIEPLQFKPWFGFAAGAISQIANIGLVIAYYVVGTQTADSILKPVLNIININLVFISNQTGLFPIIYLLASMVFLTVSGLAYLNGPAQQRRLETIIERNTAKKAKRVQDDLKNKKKQPKKPVRRY